MIQLAKKDKSKNILHISYIGTKVTHKKPVKMN